MADEQGFPRFEIYHDMHGRWRWRLWQDDGRPVAECVATFWDRKRCVEDAHAMVILAEQSAEAMLRHQDETHR